jgi:hypothetical protein
MKTIKNVASSLYFIFIAFSLLIGSMMEYFGNSYGKFIAIPGIILGLYETIKSDK